MAEKKANKTNEKPIRIPRKSNKSLFGWFFGLIVASTFSLAYFVAPFYFVGCLILFGIRHPYAYYVASPVIVSALLPPFASPLALKLISPLIDFFDYSEIHESTEAWNDMMENRRNFMLVSQPHGAFSFVGATSLVQCPPEIKGVLPTAVADALLYTPILKHILGIFGLISASKKSLQRHLKKPGVKGSIVLYVGGIAELFLSDEKQERLYLKKRKGFIKLALQSGVDVMPVYLFGNTDALSVWKNPVLAAVSRRLQVSLTYIWGLWYLPIPRPCPLLYVSGKPLGMPKIENPTNEDIDHWHTEYCAQVTRIFETYKEKVPAYKHKTLEII